jgi:hypothetical protein
MFDKIFRKTQSLPTLTYTHSANDDDGGGGGPPTEVVEYVLVWEDEPEPEPVKPKDGGWFWFFLGALFGATI